MCVNVGNKGPKTAVCTLCHCLELDNSFANL